MPHPPRPLAGLVLAVAVLGNPPAVAAEDPADALLAEIGSVAGGRTEASPRARAAWDKLVARGPDALPALLQACDTPDPVVVNWLRTAFDRIVADELRRGGKRLDADALLAFAREPKHPGRGRRLALELVDRLRPGTSRGLLPGWLDDPEFRYEAVAWATEEAEAAAAAGKNAQAAALFRRAFAATDDVPQAQRLATRLEKLGVAVSLAEHFGFLTDWYLLGPLDGKGQTGFRTAYPPEEKVDLAAELPGKAGPVRWQRHRVKEAWQGLPARVALVNLAEALGNADDAVGYAYTAFTLPEAREAEFRGAADDNFTVWVNGRRAFGFEEYRNGVRLDRHRFRVKLRAGENTVLVKVCQAPTDPVNPAPNWEFLLRLVDADGKGLPVRTALPP